MKSNASSGHMVRALQSSLDPNSADYYPQSNYFRQGVGGVSNSVVNATPFTPNRGAGGVGGGVGGVLGSSAVYGGSSGERRNNNTTNNTSNAMVGGVGGAGGLHHHALTTNGVYYPSLSQSPVGVGVGGVGGAAMYGGGGHQIGGASLPIPTAIVGGVPVPPSRMHGGKGAGQLAVGPNGVQVILSHTAVNHGKVGSGVSGASLLSPTTSGSVAAAAMIRQSPAAAVLAASMGSTSSSVTSSGNAKGGGGGGGGNNSSNGQRRGASNSTSDMSNSTTQLGAGSSSSSLPMPRSSTQLRGGAAAYAGPTLGPRTNSNNNAQMAKDPFSSAPSFQAKDILENLASSIVPAAINGEWAGSTPKFGPANPEASADKQLQSIFDQLFTLTTDTSPTLDQSLVLHQQQHQQQAGPSSAAPQSSAAPAAPSNPSVNPTTSFGGGKSSQQRTVGSSGGKVTATNAASNKPNNNGCGPNNTSNNTTLATTSASPTALLTSKNSKNTPVLGALTRGEAAHQGASTGGEVEVLSSLIAHLPSSSIPSSRAPTCPSPDRAATLSATPTASRVKPAHNNHTSTSSGQASSLSTRPSPMASAILRSPQRGEQQPSSGAIGGRSSHSASTSTTSYPTTVAYRSGDAVAESPNIHISVFAYRPTPEVSPCMGPSSARSVDDGLSCPCSQSVSPACHIASPVLPPPSDVTNAPLPLPAMVMVEVYGVADSREQNGTPTAAVFGGDGASPHCLASTPPICNVAKPNLASLLSRSSSAGTPTGGSNGGQQASVKAVPTGPPPGSMAEKLSKNNTNNNNNKSTMGLTAASSVASASSSISSVNPPPAASTKKGTPASTNATPPPMPSTTSAGRAQTLPTTKAAIERFLKEGEAPETLRHIKILAFSHEYPAEIKALFDLWAGNGIPPPDDAFGAYYWYVRKKIGRDLCMKHNGPGKAPGVGYGGCDYASRGQGQCRYHHQCLFCTKEDHGWFDEHKCGRYKTYQKELAKLKLTEDDVYELVEAYCK